MTAHNYINLLALGIVGVLAGCSRSSKSSDVSGRIRKLLDQAGLKDLTVNKVASSASDVKPAVNELEIENSQATSTA
jgi:outer membrane murein-binding lipoprotein Lpp